MHARAICVDFHTHERETHEITHATHTLYTLYCNGRGREGGNGLPCVAAVSDELMLRSKGEKRRQLPSRAPYARHPPSWGAFTAGWACHGRQISNLFWSMRGA